jgi:hypothetical protein
VSDGTSAEEPPANPQAALLNGEVPLPNAQQPAITGEPAQNAEAPGNTGGTTVGGSTGDTCASFCGGLGGACGVACTANCSGLVNVTGACAGAVSAFLDCARSASIICRPNGKLDLSDIMDCVDEAIGAGNCLDDNSGRGNDQSGN